MIGVPGFKTILWGEIPETFSEFKNSSSNMLRSATPSRLLIDKYSFVSPVRSSDIILLIHRTLAFVGAKIALIKQYLFVIPVNSWIHCIDQSVDIANSSVVFNFIRVPSEGFYIW
ncbi:LOW QUALITY PROTEIN: hypothetical protein PHPALM_30270 [Phytophthora palmivora]|uniref:Uncharacterized protein n=1 Tax=Phytophthora palmivora TaxID=4796 RepID=A0A2P4X5K8_9STRA|nr:LOW QUALITY PROTEIN: hypothetical protein PHPALM_30270 [Phytophthora palmivora]